MDVMMPIFVALTDNLPADSVGCVSVCVCLPSCDIG